MQQQSQAVLPLISTIHPVWSSPILASVRCLYAAGFFLPFQPFEIDCIP
jgi:hypothetical protein